MSWGFLSDIISNMLAFCNTLFFSILQPFFHLYQCVICLWIHIWVMAFYNMHLNLINGCIGLHFKLCFLFPKCFTICFSFFHVDKRSWRWKHQACHEWMTHCRASAAPILTIVLDIKVWK